MTAIIKRIIKEKGYNVEQTAEAAGYSKSDFENMLNGIKQITIDDIPLIAFALETSPNEILGIKSIN